MIDLMDLSLVIPVFNERENLRPLLEEIEQALASSGKTYEVVAVDDGSRDGSRELLRELASTKPYLRVVTFRRNCGQSAAFDAGFRHASGEIIVTLDADRQNDPKDIPALIAKLDEGYDFVTGWRKARQDSVLLRTMPSRLANALIRAVTNTRVHDLGCSLKATRREISSELRLYGEMHRFLSVLAELQGARVCEVVVHHRPRTAGRSKYGLNRIVKVLLDLLTVWFLRGYQTKPIYVFGGTGALMLVLGAASSAFVLYEKLWLGIWVHRNPILLIAVMLTLIGVQLLGLGLLAEMIIRAHFESANRTPYSIAEKIGFERK